MKRFAILAALAVCSPGWAQYVATPQAGVPYPALSQASPVPLQGIASAPANDVGRATLPLPFPFPFYNTTFSSVTVNANGFVTLSPISDPAASFDTNTLIPTSAEPNALVAPFWDDLVGDRTNSLVQWQTLTGGYGQGFAIEWRNWNRKATNHDLTFQVRLWENGMIEFFYGAMTGSGIAPTATIGIEAPGGGAGLYAFATCPTNNCSLRDFDPGNTGVPVSYIRIGPPTGSDLQAVSLIVDGITESAGVLSIATQVTMRNFGTVNANGFTYRLRLGPSPVAGPGDIDVSPLRQGPFSIPALGRLTHSAVSHVGKPDSGAYYVVADIDDQDTVVETLPYNNTVATSVPLASGVDLVAESLLAPTLAGPNETIVANVRFTNQGFESAGQVSVSLYASLDNVLNTPGDTLLGSASTLVNGGQNVQLPISAVVPGLLPTAEYFMIAKIDPGDVVAERFENNNVVVATELTRILQADLVVENFRVTRPVSPFDTTDTAFFAEPIRFEATIRNQGGATVADAGVLFYLSTNESLNGAADSEVAIIDGIHMPPGAVQVVSATGVVPTRDRLDAGFVPGAYYFFAAAFAPGVREGEGENNFQRSTVTNVRFPAANLKPLQIQGPIRAGAGEVLTVSRALANVGTQPATDVRYRYYLSANTDITATDTPLTIVTATGDFVERTIQLGAGQIDTATETVRVPFTSPTGLMYLGVLLDPMGQVDETDKRDNGLASSLITVIPQGLTLNTRTLPDGVVGRPYTAQLAGSGAANMTYRLAQGSTLPPMLTISSNGRIEGVPSESGAYSFTIEAVAGARLVLGTVLIRVTTPTATMSISTMRLPAPARSQMYDTQLGVYGGKAPYQWVRSGVLPTGLELATDGRITGTPIGALGTVSTFKVRVTDSIGNSDERTYTLTVVDSSPLVLTPAALPNGIVGVDYLVPMALANTSQAPVSKPVRWEIVDGALPDGLTLERSTIDNVILSGRPTAPGIARFRVEATDGQGRTESVGHLIVISPPSDVRINGDIPGLLPPGQTVSVQLELVPSVTGARFSVREGALPPGITLESTGLLSGTTPDDAARRPYNFTIAVGVGDGAPFVTRPVGVVVGTEELRPARCEVSGAAPMVFLALGSLSLLLRRRKPMNS